MLKKKKRPRTRTHTHAHARSGGRYSIAPGNAEVPPGPRHAATAPSQLMRQRRGTTEGPNCTRLLLLLLLLLWVCWWALPRLPCWHMQIYKHTCALAC